MSERCGEVILADTVHLEAECGALYGAPDFGSFVRADAILWATGFRAALDHLAPLRLRVPGGGIRVADSRATDEPRLFLVGYGPSASTVGANRAGRAAVAAIVRDLDAAAERVA